MGKTDDSLPIKTPESQKENHLVVDESRGQVHGCNYVDRSYNLVPAIGHRLEHLGPLDSAGTWPFLANWWNLLILKES
jgi:hypothetical protein